MNRRPLASAVVLTIVVSAAALTATSCSSSKSSPKASKTHETNPSGDIPDSVSYPAFRPPGEAFEVSTPETFARADAGGRIIFTDRLNSITIETAKATAPPTIDGVKSTDVPVVSKRYAAFVLTDVTTVTRKSGPAILVTFTADSAPDPVTAKVIHLAVERYTFFHVGEVVTLTLAGPVGADNVDPWRTVTDSLHWL